MRARASVRRRQSRVSGWGYDILYSSTTVVVGNIASSDASLFVINCVLRTRSRSMQAAGVILLFSFSIPPHCTFRLASSLALLPQQRSVGAVATVAIDPIFRTPPPPPPPPLDRHRRNPRAIRCLLAPTLITPVHWFLALLDGRHPFPALRRYLTVDANNLRHPLADRHRTAPHRHTNNRSYAVRGEPATSLFILLINKLPIIK